MAGFLSKIFSKKEPETEVIEYSSLPELFAETKKEAEESIHRAALSAAEKAGDSLVSLNKSLDRFEKRDLSDDAHPNKKLLNVARNSKPKFIGSMRKAIEAGISDDPEKVYDSMISFVNESAKIMKGKGRYLGAAFPEEMKAVKSGIDSVGKLINKMTEEVKIPVELKEKSGISEGKYDLIEDKYRQIRGDNERISALADKMSALKGEISDIESGMENLKGSAEFSEEAELISRLEALEMNFSAAENDYEALIASTGNVFRKSSYQFSRENNKEMAGKVESLIDILSKKNDKCRLMDEAVELYSSVYPSLATVFGANPDIIKNKTEEELFSSPGVFPEKLKSCCNELKLSLDEIDAVKREAEGYSSGRELGRLSKRYEANTEGIVRLEEESESLKFRISESEGEIPELMRDLEESLNDWRENPVELKF
ncbi:hypothetical protein [Methanoplanus endosymbiosus]|uniref:Uncharacterized protein n=1 Tax=Methanoplanus endosymbiosus TaxID=33865 RepID=A0A9E7PLS4_9EURY|nr:hypothetical protein [Methanoplanus endosymbiosus]UUX91697.1 hypothetical protein L6E24_09985 [Methanoplanus endosymbiosus]